MTATQRALVEALDVMASLRSAHEAIGETLDADFGFWSAPSNAQFRTRVYRAWKFLEAAITAADQIHALARAEQEAKHE